MFIELSRRLSHFAKAQFSEKNFSDDMRGGTQFKKHLGSLLQGARDTELAFHNGRLRLGSFYSLAINSLDDASFRRKEGSILDARMGSGSYQRFRSKLFFQHLIAYALLQVCAAAVDNKLRITNGIKRVSPT